LFGVYGQVVQAFLDQESNDAIRVEDKVGSFCVLVADHTAKHQALGLGKDRVTYVRRAMSCGV